MMRGKVTVRGGERMGRNLREFPAKVQREHASVLKQEARALAVEYGRATVPGPGFGEAALNKFAERVERDVRRVFASRAQPHRVYDLMLRHAPELAAAYWAKMKRGDTRGMNAILRRANLPAGIDPGDLKRARTGRKGRVPKNADPASLAPEPQVRSLAKRQRALVGLAKAGWYAAAKGLGGRVRRTTTDTTGKRSSEEIFPGPIRKLAGKFSGLGGARVTGSGVTLRIEIFTSVRHAAAALTPGLYASATDRARDNVRRSLQNAVREMNARQFKTKKAA
jgi:hypothetical protein